MRDFVLGDQADSNILMFNTSFSYEIREDLITFMKSSRGRKSGQTNSI